MHSKKWPEKNKFGWVPFIIEKDIHHKKVSMLYYFTFDTYICLTGNGWSSMKHKIDLNNFQVKNLIFWIMNKETSKFDRMNVHRWNCSLHTCINFRLGLNEFFQRFLVVSLVFHWIDTPKNSQNFVEKALSPIPDATQKKIL